jgi:cytochrome c553
MNPALLALPALISLCAASVAQTLPVSTRKGDRELGQYLAAECVTCHQTSGRQSGGVPSITGWPDDQFVAVMLSYKSKDRDNQIMQTIAARLSDEEIDALAVYFAEQTTQK